MPPSLRLPLPSGRKDESKYVDELLEFITTSDLLQTLCGGVHILDFLVRDSDLYESVLPEEWRNWLKLSTVPDLLNVLMGSSLGRTKTTEDAIMIGPDPPSSMLEYVHKVNDLALNRAFHGPQSRPKRGKAQKLSRQVSVGMNSKKIHEVENFAAFVDDLVEEVADTTTYHISHVVDFGSGQNYLGRALASPAYRRDVIGIESKLHNITGAQRNDVLARIVERQNVWRDKKTFRDTDVNNSEGGVRRKMESRSTHGTVGGDPGSHAHMPSRRTTKEKTEIKATNIAECGRIKYVEQKLLDGNIAPVLAALDTNGDSEGRVTDPQLLVTSLHSCGNLLHHGLRSLILNDTVKVVAMIGCCYNLMTERLGGPTYKIPKLRTPNKRLEETAIADDPHGFPMSERLASYQHKEEVGIKWNITARMMAVQAPQNWTQQDCDSFFKRHFYRALLQRVLVDQGIIQQTRRKASDAGEAGHPITIGSLSKSCYVSFIAYVRGALRKLANQSDTGQLFRQCDEALTDQAIEQYTHVYSHRKHDLCVLWCFMAFSAGLVESSVVVDRWLWLKEQVEVADCWVQTVFDYRQSPRNLVVVGVKKHGRVS